MIIDVKRPLEAVHKTTGKIVPMKFKKMLHGALDGAFTTVASPCTSTSNNTWSVDGEDWCSHKEWIIRNVKEHTMPIIDVNKPVHLADGREATYIGGSKTVRRNGRPAAKFRIKGSPRVDPTFPRFTDNAWFYYLDTGEYVKGPGVTTLYHKIVQNVLDTSKPLQTRSGSKVKLEGKLTDGRLVVSVNYGPHRISSETKIVPADGRVLRQSPGSVDVQSQDDIINVPVETVVKFYNIYDDGTVSDAAKASYETALQATRYHKVRVGILEVHTVSGGRTFSKVHPTTPQLRTPMNTEGFNPYS